MSAHEVAAALLAARRDARACDASAFALADADEAYDVQRLVARSLGQDGAPRCWKSGGPSRTATLTHAALPPRGVLASPADVRGMHFNLRLVEAEIALRVGHDVTMAQADSLTHEEALRCIDAMTVAIEIVDSRWQQGVDAPPLLKLADLQSHGALVLGEWLPFTARDWATQACTVRIGADVPEEFIGSHALQDPAWLLPHWLRHATRNGAVVQRGTVVTTGTWCGMRPRARVMRSP